MSRLVKNTKRLVRSRINKRNRDNWAKNYLENRPKFSYPIYGNYIEIAKREGFDKRFGSFVYNETNVGDDVQTIAQLGFIPLAEDILPYNRDEVASYAGEKRIFIMNGWYSNFPWPPSPQIDPIFISFHIAHNDLAKESLASYYKQHEPIGCRDEATVKKLRGIGVEAYFSGCLTLTLNNPYSKDARNGRVLVVDAHLDSENTYPPSTPRLLKRLVPESILKDAIYLEQEVAEKYANNYLFKTAQALRLLELYAKAKLVITTRLHCALPCLALGTPVVFMHERYETDIRFDGYREILNGYSMDAVAADINWDSPVPADIAELRGKVINDITQRMHAKLEVGTV